MISVAAMLVISVAAMVSMSVMITGGSVLNGDFSVYKILNGSVHIP